MLILIHPSRKFNYIFNYYTCPSGRNVVFRLKFRQKSVFPTTKIDFCSINRNFSHQRILIVLLLKSVTGRLACLNYALGTGFVGNWLRIFRMKYEVYSLWSSPSLLVFTVLSNLFIKIEDTATI